MDFDEVYQELLKYQINPKVEWVKHAMIKFRDSISDIFLDFLESDISFTSNSFDFIFNDKLNKYPLFRVSQNLILQVNEIVDISQPYKKRKNFVISSRTTLKFQLTDGKNNIIGISKRQFKKLKINPASMPGMKILLKPPIEFRYGILFITDENIQLLGGYSSVMIEKRNYIIYGLNLTYQNEHNLCKNNYFQDILSANKISYIPNYWTKKEKT